jgi:hypothetical protein
MGVNTDLELMMMCQNMFCLFNMPIFFVDVITSDMLEVEAPTANNTKRNFKGILLIINFQSLHGLWILVLIIIIGWKALRIIYYLNNMHCTLWIPSNVIYNS